MKCPSASVVAEFDCGEGLPGEKLRARTPTSFKGRWVTESTTVPETAALPSVPEFWACARTANSRTATATARARSDSAMGFFKNAPTRKEIGPAAEERTDSPYQSTPEQATPERCPGRYRRQPDVCFRDGPSLASNIHPRETRQSSPPRRQAANTT